MSSKIWCKSSSAHIRRGSVVKKPKQTRVHAVFTWYADSPTRPWVWVWWTFSNRWAVRGNRPIFPTKHTPLFWNRASSIKQNKICHACLRDTANINRYNFPTLRSHWCRPLLDLWARTSVKYDEMHFTFISADLWSIENNKRAPMLSESKAPPSCFRPSPGALCSHSPKIMWKSGGGNEILHHHVLTAGWWSPLIGSMQTAKTIASPISLD